MKILIFGGAGFVGGNLAVKFAAEGHHITCVDNLVRRGSENNLRRFLGNKNIDFIHADIRCREDLKNITVSPDIVLECSAQPTAIDGYKNPMFDFTNNTGGLINVLEFCRERSSALIFWSTNKVYAGDKCNATPIVERQTRLEWDDQAPANIPGWSTKGFSEDFNVNGGNHTIYGVTKLTSDLFCQEWSTAFDIPIIVNRFSCLYGPYQFGKVSQGWITWFVLAKKFGLDLAFYGFEGKQVRDYLHIDDMFMLVQSQIDKIDQHRGSYYNVGGGCDNTTSVQELEQYLVDTMGVKSTIHQGPARNSDQKIYISDITRVCDDFSWAPQVSFEDGIQSVIDWTNSGENFEWLPKK